MGAPPSPSPQPPSRWIKAERYCVVYQTLVRPAEPPSGRCQPIDVRSESSQRLCRLTSDSSVVVVDDAAEDIALVDNFSS